MSAAVERSRRATAGKRMGTLVGKAQEEDDTFWNHETWAEDSDSGNESFRSSDEDSEAKQDVFDSDFNESESEEEDEEGPERAYDVEAEKELALEEKRSSSKKRPHIDISKAGRDLMQKKKGKGKKRIMGDGLNAGIVLKFPGAAPVQQPLLQQPGAVVANQQQPPATAATIPKVTETVSPLPSQQQQQQEMQQKPAKKTSPTKKDPLRTRRRATRAYDPGRRAVRQSTQTAGEASKQAATDKAKDAAAHQTGKSTKEKRKRLYTQGELLLEAVNVTEPENERWLLGRKRIMDLAEADKERHLSQQNAQGARLIQRFHSRRGYLDTINFPDMDHVPEVLTQDKPPQPPLPKICVITGKKARYRDPRTQLHYYDLSAFKELRCRHEAGEPLQQPIKQASGSATTGTVREAESNSTTVTATSNNISAKPISIASATSDEPETPAVVSNPPVATPVSGPQAVKGAPTKKSKTAVKAKRSVNKLQLKPAARANKSTAKTKDTNESNIAVKQEVPHPASQASALGSKADPADPEENQTVTKSNSVVQPDLTSSLTASTTANAPSVHPKLPQPNNIPSGPQAALDVAPTSPKTHSHLVVTTKAGFPSPVSSNGKATANSGSVDPVAPLTFKAAQQTTSKQVAPTNKKTELSQVKILDKNTLSTNAITASTGRSSEASKTASIPTSTETVEKSVPQVSASPAPTPANTNKSTSKPAPPKASVTRKTSFGKTSPKTSTPLSPSRKSPRRRKPTKKAIEAQVAGAPPLPGSGVPKEGTGDGNK